MFHLTSVSNACLHVDFVRFKKNLITGDKEKQFIDEIFSALTKLINDPNCSSFGRDNTIDLCLKYVDVANGCAWTMRFLEQGTQTNKLEKCVYKICFFLNSIALAKRTTKTLGCWIMCRRSSK